MGAFSWKMWATILIIIVLDQFLKTWVKLNLSIGESILVFDWFLIHFVENNGFAFGLEFFGKTGKVLLTIVRICFVVFIFKWVSKMIRRGVSQKIIFPFILIISGALGNIIDSVFYGFFYDYAPLFYGRVVDMFYFPLISGTYPEWFPFWGGERFVFFKYIFNIADASITIGGGWLLLFYNSAELKY